MVYMNDIENEYEFQQAVEQVMSWIAKNGNPHMRVEVTNYTAEILSGEYLHKTYAYIKN